MRKTILRLILLVDAIFIVVLLMYLGERIFFFLPKEPSLLEKEKKETISEKPELFEKVESTEVVTEISTLIKKKRNIRFKHWAPQAKKVEIVGDFNNWIPTAMSKGKNQHWIIDCQLEPGEYTYKFLIDGRLKKDPYNPHSVPDGYGGESSLLIVKPLNADVRR